MSGTNASCSDETVANVLDKALAIQLHPTAPSNHTTDVSLVSHALALLEFQLNGVCEYH